MAAAMVAALALRLGDLVVRAGGRLGRPHREPAGG
jgi:hypothetical protein